jgi:hypothetical protein
VICNNDTLYPKLESFKISELVNRYISLWSREILSYRPLDNARAGVCWVEVHVQVQRLWFRLFLVGWGFARGFIVTALARFSEYGQQLFSRIPSVLQSGMQFIC